MKKIRINTFCSVRISEITSNGVRYEDKDGMERFIWADLVLYCCGSRPNKNTVKELEGCCPNFVVTGDSRQARTVKMATYEGFCSAMDII